MTVIPVVELCERLQEMWLSQAIAQSTWGYPIVGALHVLAIAWFGGFVLITNLCALGLAFRRHDLPGLEAETRLWKAIGLAAVVTTGTLLFASGAVHYYNSAFFRMKMVLLALILLNALLSSLWRRAADSHNAAVHSGISLALWAAVVLAARGIAFF